MERPSMSTSSSPDSSPRSQRLGDAACITSGPILQEHNLGGKNRACNSLARVQQEIAIRLQRERNCVGSVFQRGMSSEMHNLRGRGREIDGTDLALSGSSACSTLPRRATW